MRNEICIGTLKVNNIDPLFELITKHNAKLIDTATAYPGAVALLEKLITKLKETKGEEFVSSLTVFLKIRHTDLPTDDSSIENIEKALKKLAEPLKPCRIVLMYHSPACLLNDHACNILDATINLKNQNIFEAIGVSNFDKDDLERLGANYLSYISYNQFEMSPFYCREELINYCKEHSIQPMTYRNFGYKLKDSDFSERDREIFSQCEEKYNANIHKIILASVLNQNIIPVVKASNNDHMLENKEALNIKLDSEDITKIYTLNRNYKTVEWEGFLSQDDLSTMEYFKNRPIESASSYKFV